MALNANQIARLWVQQGGAPKYANLMAKIALRESGGNPSATHVNTNGTTDRGLFQINSIWGGLSQKALGDPAAATRAAIHILKVQGPKAWATYNPATDSKFLGGFKGGGSGGPGTRTTTTTTGLTPEAASAKKALISQFLSDRPHTPTAHDVPGARRDNGLLDFALGVRSVNGQTQTTKSVKTTGGGGGGGNAPTGDQSATDFARSRLGHYKEVGGNNIGPELDTLQNRFGMRGEAWCAMFATTAAAHGGASRAVRTAGVAQIAQWAQERSHGYAGYFKPSQAQPGDLFIIQKNGVSHTGVVDYVKGGVVHTIEGNTSSGAVSRGTRSFGELSGVARPKYHRR